MKKHRVSLTTDAHHPAFDDFADAMRAAESREGWRSSEVLRHFLEASFFAIKGRLLFGEAWDANEAEYMAIVGRCRHPKETMTALATMLGATTCALLAEPVDFIGPVFSELSADSGMGQFFTPHHLSYAMAKMTLADDPRSMIGDAGHLRLMEPCCGVGGMILASNVALREAGIDVAKEAHWTAIDIDHRAMCACYLQLALTDCSADVYRGNALALSSEWTGTRTPAAFLFPKKVPAGPIPTDTTPIAPPAPIPAPDSPAQLTLF